MGKYGKILKIKDNNKFCSTILLLDQLDKTGTYPSIMKDKYNEGYTQVIINSYLMLKVAEKMIIDGWTLGKIEVDDPSIDENTKIEISNLLDEIKKSSLNFKKLESYLDWALDEGSIFIDKIIMGKTKEDKFYNFILTSSGIQRGNHKEEVFETYIKEVVEVFLNGR